MKNYVMNQRVLGSTELFGKVYFWMQDPEGKIYLAHAKKTDTGWEVDFGEWE